MTRQPAQSESELTEKSPEDSLRRSLNVSSLEHTFDNFKVTNVVVETYQAFRRFSEKLEPPLLLCYGGIGNGKTYMLEATAIRLRERGLFAKVSIWNRFTGILKDTLRDKNSAPSYEQTLINWCKSPIVLMDDYGLGTTDTIWEKAILEHLVDFRYRERLPTVLTTNMRLRELPERVISRFSESGIGLIVENRGGDYRRRERGKYEEMPA